MYMNKTQEQSEPMALLSLFLIFGSVRMCERERYVSWEQFLFFFFSIDG